MSGIQSLKWGKFSFKIKSNPLASNMGNQSVGKWDPIPNCDKMRTPSAGLNGMTSFFCFFCFFFSLRQSASKSSKPGDGTICTLEGFLVQAAHMSGSQLFASKIKKYMSERVYSYCY